MQSLKLSTCAKVGELTIALKIHEYVCTLEVTMHHLLGVQEVKSIENLSCVLSHELDFISTKALQQGPYGPVWHVLKENQNGRHLIIQEAAKVPDNARVLKAS